jgi:hypothetical protein
MQFTVTMKFQYRIEPDRKMVIVTSTGFPDFPTSVDAIRAVVSDPAFGPDFGVLCDFREVQYNPSVAELLDVGNFLAMPSILKGHKIALVVSSDTHFSLAGLLAKIANTWGTNIEVFRMVDQAETWLRQNESG